MARIYPRLFLAAALAVAAVSAQDCQIPAETGSLTLPQVRVQLASGHDEFFLYQRLLDLTPTRPKPGILAADFQKKLEQHPDDARFLYLYGRSLIGKDTPQAIVYLNGAAEAAPRLPWVYTALALIYSSPNFLDQPKLFANARAYCGLCPANVDGFRYLSKVKDQAKIVEFTGQLRPLLEAGRDPGDADLWSLVWAAEFRRAPKDDYAELRQRVAADVKRLESLPPPHDRKFMLALLDGYNLSGQTDLASKIDQRLNSDWEAGKAYHTWADKNRTRTRRVPPEEHQAMMQDLAGQAADWVVKWPSSEYAWETRLTTLGDMPNWTKQELEQAGEEVLKLDTERDMGWSYVPGKLRVAETWARNGVRLKDAVKLAEEALDEISQGPEVMSDLTAPPDAAKVAAAQLFGFHSSIWDAMAAVVGGSVQLKDFDKAETMLSKMRQWLQDNQAESDDPSSGYARFQGRYFQAAGKIAEAKGNKLDAAGFYAMRPVAPKLAVVKTSSTVETAVEFAAWTPVGQPLPEMNLQDLPGKSWTLARLKGKTTFVTVWATWCGPCRDELPQVQKLYEQSQTRGDVQVITLDIDENPGEVEPFMKSRNYTFPVIMSARKYVEDTTEHFRIPMNWLVDRSVVLREKSLGFDSKAADWPKQMLEKLAELK
jgi:thiol-disulfide isomerase/thioredoxin